MSDTRENCPQGIVAILVNKDGKELAVSTDFYIGKPGGFSQKEAQEIRAKRSLAFSMIRKLSSPILAESIDDYTAEQVMDKMCKNGCRVHLVAVGYNIDGEAA